jgi:glucose dehydrogenase
MSTTPFSGSIAGRLAVLLLTACTVAQAAEEPKRIAASPAFTTKQLSAAPRTGWITNGGSINNQRYSPLTSLNRDNVAKLKGKWRVSLKTSERRVSAHAQPLIHEGVLYIVTGTNDVYAIDIESGQVLWTYEAKLDPADVVLRLDEPRPWHGGGEDIRGTAGCKAGGARSAHGQSGVVHPG